MVGTSQRLCPLARCAPRGWLRWTLPPAISNLSSARRQCCSSLVPLASAPAWHPRRQCASHDISHTPLNPLISAQVTMASPLRRLVLIGPGTRSTSRAPHTVRTGAPDRLRCLWTLRLLTRLRSLLQDCGWQRPHLRGILRPEPQSGQRPPSRLGRCRLVIVSKRTPDTAGACCSGGEWWWAEASSGRANV
jgi:hypothetical protein